MKVEEILNKNIAINNEYKIVRKKENDDYVIVFLDNNEKIYVDAENFFKYNIGSLEVLDEEIYNKLKDAEKIYLAYKGTLRKLAIKDCTIKQITDYLKIKKELSDGEIADIVSKLIEYGLLDDEKYCINRVTYLRKQLFSTKQIKFKLFKDGISKDLIEKYVINNNEEEYNNAVKLATRYSNCLKNKSTNAMKQTIISKIVSAGYSYDNAKSAVESLNISNKKEKEILNIEYQKAKKKYENKYSDYELYKHIYSYLLNKGFNSKDIKGVM